MLLFDLVNISDKPGEAFIDGLIPSLICVLIVFVILGLIYAILSILNKVKALDVKEEPVVETKKVTPTTNKVRLEDITDDDMMAAVLVATIDYQNETKKDVRLVNVKKIG